MIDQREFNGRLTPQGGVVKRNHGTLAQRLLARVDSSKGNDECWLWTGYLEKNGYGKIMSNRRTRWVHRVAYEVANGPIPAGMHVCHHCDVPPCCNPAHLFLGTHQDNQRDKASKGRAGKKITAAIAKEIRTATGTQRSIAAQYGLNKKTVSQIRKGLIWNRCG